MRLSLLLVAGAAFALAGCATVVPSFDIPSNAAGKPSIDAIRRAIICELGQIANRNDISRYLSTAHDVNVAVLLNLDVTDDGALAPSFSYIDGPLTATFGASLEQSREQNFQQQLLYSLKEVKFTTEGLLDPSKPGSVCALFPETNLAGSLGIKESWDLALTGVSDTNWSATGQTGVFGGYVNFIVKKQLLATGPTWALKHFKGPGSFLTGYDNNIDRLTFAFVQGPAATDKQRTAGKIAATEFLKSVVQNQLGNALTSIQSASH